MLNNKELFDFYQNKSLWTGCFGAMTIIRHDFLQEIFAKYDLKLLIGAITTRFNRSSFERVIACILQKEHHPANVLFGDIHQFGRFPIRIDDPDFDSVFKKLPIMKFWTGR